MLSARLLALVGALESFGDNASKRAVIAARLEELARDLAAWEAMAVPPHLRAAPERSEGVVRIADYRGRSVVG